MNDDHGSLAAISDSKITSKKIQIYDLVHESMERQQQQHQPLALVQSMNCSQLFFASHSFSVVCHRNRLGSYCLAHENYYKIGNVNFCRRNHHGDSDVHDSHHDSVVWMMIDWAVMVMHVSAVAAPMAVVR